MKIWPRRWRWPTIFGHPPFGHAGERALDACLAAFGGFDHNAQTLRVVTALERRYPAFDGLNLTWETLEGLVKHNGPLTGRDGTPLGHYREHGIPETILDYSRQQDLQLWSFPSVEAQIAAFADDIAYDAHDIDDGLRAELFDLDDIATVALPGRIIGDIRATHPGLDAGRQVHELIRRLIGLLIEDVIAETSRKLAALAPQLGRRGAAGQNVGRRLLAGDGGSRPRHQKLPESPHVSSRPRHACHGSGGGRGARPVCAL